MNKIQARFKRALRRLSRADPPPVPAVREIITGDPKLPPELEREIFELVVATDFPSDYWSHQHVGDTTLVLPQVCRRAQSWIEPFIYERVALLQNYNGRDPFSSFLATVDARPATFFAARVKHLYLDRMVPLYAVQRILSVCTSVVSFGCHHPYTALAPLLSSLPLTRLLVSEVSFPNPSTPPRWSSTLTHLGLSSSLPASASTTLAHLPSLTHLAVDYSALPDPEAPGIGSALTTFLIAVPHARYLVLLTGAKTEYRWALQRLRDDAFVDKRVYVHLGPIGDAPWHAWSWRLPDCFEVAEKELQRRR
ncbi:hypothetical protein FB45DRAFT_1062985 [Roridomyces roridus]|uniref:Uncharacterized protein n=1 Tax=Roridomyces roridus TaxID=1738132 RepID=A0AAD7BGA5_9AGAR|nr:hypothetical protein FB45DRAFT_1062985 [Roridomyces roridus]